MCEVYIKADPILYESRSRSLRIHGAVTTVRLENQFWDILSEMAAGEDKTANQLIVQLYEEVINHHGKVENFSSFLRVCCMRYLLGLVAVSFASAPEPFFARSKA